eukprot:513020-Alexandrium_andersonii.AAC.1
MSSRFAWWRSSAALLYLPSASRCTRRPMAVRRLSAARRPKPAGSGLMTGEGGRTASCVPGGGAD